jgi:hypothetical protein
LAEHLDGARVVRRDRGSQVISTGGRECGHCIKGFVCGSVAAL